MPALVSGIVASGYPSFLCPPSLFFFIFVLRMALASQIAIRHTDSNLPLIGFQPETRAQIPNWDGLLFAYGIISIPVFFSLLVGVNILVWSRSRINYVFIFGKGKITFHPSCGSYFVLFDRTGSTDTVRSS